MNFKEKIFVNKRLDDLETKLVKSFLEKIDIQSYLEDYFVYIYLHEDSFLEIYSVENKHIQEISKEFNITNKMSMEYLKDKTEIEQELNEIFYWNGINNIKKYVPVLSDDNRIEYADFNVYAEGIADAIRILNDFDFYEYIYINDVDEEI
ncbi:MAG: hypothetical protein ABF265_07085 [Polaribacter sp.]